MYAFLPATRTPAAAVDCTLPREQEATCIAALGFFLAQLDLGPETRAPLIGEMVGVVQGGH